MDTNGGRTNSGYVAEEDTGDPKNNANARKESVVENTRNRKVTKEALYSSRETRRQDCVRRCRSITEQLAIDGVITQMDFLLKDKDFANCLFNLFDQDSYGSLDQNEWFEMVKVNTSGARFEHLTVEARLDIVEMIENATYIICGEDNIEHEQFRKIVTSRGVREKLFRLADANGDGELAVDEVIDFLVVLSKPRHTDDFTPEQIRQLEEVFQKNLPPNKNFLTLQEFKKIMPSKNAFFVEQAFKIFDIDGNGKISLPEFLDKMYQYARCQNESEKVLFLFKVYDIDGDGMLQEEELGQIMRECLRENGMELPESDVQDLAFALYEEALGDEDDTGEISIDQLKVALAKHEGLLENLTISLAKWMVPQKPRIQQSFWQRTKATLKSRFSARHAQSQWQLFAFFFFLFAINIILFVTRAVYFQGFSNLDGTTPNPFYMLSRANGRTLLFNSTMILVVVLRYTVTKLRDLGLSMILPLDHNIYVHKIIGIVIFIQAWWHTIMHLINFAVNVQPDPVKFAQLNTDYWKPAPLLEGYEQKHPNWHNLGYALPDGCSLILDGVSEGCPNTSLILDRNVTACQLCQEDGQPWNYGEWIFTMRPGVFGLVGGIANPSGVALIIILTVMVICSMPFVRKSGYFQVFYFTHLLYYAYMVLLILHAPDFWKWVIAPLLVFMLEKLFRGMSTIVGHGKSYIEKATVLPSRVTALTIKRPDGFKYSPGDWMFVRIPKIATYEWHPFTISSAPEDREFVTLHIRGVGQWTNRLYNYFEKKKQQVGRESRRVSTKCKTEGSVKHRKEQETLEDVPEGREVVHYGDGKDTFDVVVNKHYETKLASNYSVDKRDRLEIFLDGPFGAPASNIFRAEHAVLVATGIGVTPFSSILQSIMYRYVAAKRECPKCHHRWLTDLGQAMMALRKVDFFWINRDQKSFEWFLKLLGDMEAEQQSEDGSEGVMGRFMDVYLYFTAALQRTDMRAVGMHLAMDLLHKKRKGTDVMTGLKARTNAGRPNWDRIFKKIQDQHKGRVTVFYCGNPFLAKTLRAKCEEFGFNFRKEVF